MIMRMGDTVRMTVGEDIVRWAAGRPLWQQRVLKTLAEGASIPVSEISVLADELVSEQGKGAVAPLDLAMSSSDDSQVTLVAVRGCKGVNALVDEQLLDFSPVGLNIIYGDNGSGKSGYARLIKDMVGARHPAEILAEESDNPVRAVSENCENSGFEKS